MINDCMNKRRKWLVSLYPNKYIYEAIETKLVGLDKEEILKEMKISLQGI